MKKILKKNQVIITSLAVLIAVAGYLNFADVDLGLKNKEASADSSSILEDVDYDLTDETALLDENGADSSLTDVQDQTTSTPGEAVLTAASDFAAQAKLSREQIRSQNKDTLNEIINNTNLSTMTSAADLWDGYELLREVADRTGIPVAYTTGKKEFLEAFVAKSGDPAYVGRPVAIDMYMHRDWDSYIAHGINTVNPNREMY